MITINEAEEFLKKDYNRQNFLFIINEILLNDFCSEEHDISFSNSIFYSVKQLGTSSSCDITIFEVILNKNCQNKRVGITQSMFKILRNFRIDNALVVFSCFDERNFRISLLTSRYEYDGNAITRVLSNPKRYSYSLGNGTKTKTAYKFLISSGKANNLFELTKKFSIEVVNKEFYSEISTSFTKLIGGTRNGKFYNRLLNIKNEKDDKKYAEFSVRLIGRIVFCRFLHEKISKSGTSLLPNEYFMNLEQSNYYHTVLEPLFFELLNTSLRRRKDYFNNSNYKLIPYLNGGLFNPQQDDHYKYNPEKNCGDSSSVTIPDSWFKEFYSILNTYNFTVDENTSYDIELSIDPEMLGRIFENLLAEIDPETEDNAKKNTGSFYTPRDIVDYMVDESLVKYLSNRTNVGFKKIINLLNYAKNDDNELNFADYEKKEIIDALYNLTILDPACGSGAFPMGMLQKIVYILQELDPDAKIWFNKVTINVNSLLKNELKNKFENGSFNYIRKLSIIQNSIFGVDIQPIAVEISRLRCFLSLIIEEEVDDEKYNRGINPLPNLDFKFISANSLVKIEKNVDSLFADTEAIENLKQIREEYFNADNDIRNELKCDFLQTQQNMLLNNANVYTYCGSDEYVKLSSWKPFSNELTKWFDSDWMFGIKEGFDIIIGNPPYIQLQSNKGTLSKELFNQKYKVFEKTGDIYCLFYERSIDLLKKDGLLTFITSNKWMRAGYGKKLRSFLSEKNPQLLIDFGGTQVFDSATVDVCILQILKNMNEGKTKICQIKKSTNNLSDYIQQNFTYTNFNNSENRLLLSNIEDQIKKKIEAIGIPLSEFNISINYGIKTGLNEAFIIDENIKNRLINEDPKSAELIKPLLRGRDIRRFGYKESHKYLINAHNGLKEKNIPGIDINEYESVKKYMDCYKSNLFKRTDHGDTPYNLRSCSYMDDFSKRKIIYPETTQKANFCIDEKGIFADKTCFIMTGDNLDYIIVTLSSSLFEFAYKKIFSSIELGKDGYQYNKHALNKLPVKFPNKDENFRCIQLYKSVLENKNTLEMDDYIFSLYNINEEEKEYINSFVNRK